MLNLDDIIRVVATAKGSFYEALIVKVDPLFLRYDVNYLLTLGRAVRHLRRTYRINLRSDQLGYS